MLNQYDAIRAEVQESTLELTQRAIDYGNSAGDMAALRQQLDELMAELPVLLDKVLADMNNAVDAEAIWVNFIATDMEIEQNM